MLERDLFGEIVPPTAHDAVLAQTWEYPPFSVLNAREGWWQERKRAWLATGLQSELGRGDGLAYGAAVRLRPAGALSGTSIFDPVVAELCYKWWSPPGGRCVDPFAGGSVRGIVAAALGRRYEGCELRAEQVAANRAQRLLGGPAPVWVCDDSQNIQAHFSPGADFVFSCPPYADLEVYSDDPADISNHDYPGFLAKYRHIIAETCALLAPDRFACFVVGEVRDKRGGAYRNFVGDTVEAFRAAGLAYYNQAILVTPIGTLPFRVGRQFAAGRKLGAGHQHVLCFVKGCGKRAARACGGAAVG